MEYDREVTTITDILETLDKFDNKEEIINAIKRSLFDIETDWHNEEYLKQQLSQLQQEKEELIKWLKTEYVCFDNESDECIIARQILSKLKESDKQ